MPDREKQMVYKTRRELEYAYMEAGIVGVLQTTSPF